VSGKQAVTGKISAAKAGLSLLLLFAIWVAFIVAPAREEARHKILPLDGTAAAKLRSLGLPDNPDLDALPGIFSIWEAKAEWNGGKTRFAYWHPVMKAYSYYFEAVRTDKGVRFRDIREPHDPDHGWDESLPDDCPIRFYVSTGGKTTAATSELPKINPPTVANPDKVKIDMPAPKIVTSEKLPITVMSQF